VFALNTQRCNSSINMWQKLELWLRLIINNATVHGFRVIGFPNFVYRPGPNTEHGFLEDGSRFCGEKRSSFLFQ
jgi:hypothetical protein